MQDTCIFAFIPFISWQEMEFHPAPFHAAIFFSAKTQSLGAADSSACCLFHDTVTNCSVLCIDT